MGHDELHSLPFHIPAKRIEFWMGFSEQYLTCFNVLNQLGFLSHKPINVGDQQVIPLHVVKALLPDPAALAPEHTGKVCIGCLVKGRKNGEEKKIFIHTICDHAECFRDVEAQAIAYTTAVPAVTAALLIARGDWNVNRMVNVEELDSDPFLALMPEIGLNWSVRRDPS
ncbi:MAG: carboxynorspermidine synthase [Verrucomicrobiales bacterium]|jgi:carboxynorspermidine synthase